MRVANVVRRFIGRVCLIIGAMWLSWQVISLCKEGIGRLLEDRTQAAALPSPDNRHVAIVMVTVGSFGAMSTWCETAIYVKEADAAGALPPGDADRAFIGGCDFAIGNRPENLKWISPSNLEVSFDPEIAGQVSLSSRVMNGSVTVSYAIRKGQYPF